MLGEGQELFLLPEIKANVLITLSNCNCALLEECSFGSALILCRASKMEGSECQTQGALRLSGTHD